jgi:DNA gyrase subunit B
LSRTLRGVTERYVIDSAVMKSAEARKLDEMAAELQGIYARPATLVTKEKESRVIGPLGLVATILESGKKGLAIQRYKGLGEMNPEQLWETTLDPNVRTLLQVKVTHADEAESVFSTLMGEVVEPRRDFIHENALKVANLDV